MKKLGNRWLVLLSAALIAIAVPTRSTGVTTVQDLAGDTDPVVPVPPDLLAVTARTAGEVVTFSAELIPGTGFFDPQFEDGLLIVPGSQARTIGPVYRVFLDTDQDQETGRAGFEYELDVTFFRSFPTEDPTDGVTRSEPFLAAFLWSYAASGARISARVIETRVLRSDDGFEVDLPLEIIDDDGSLDFRVGVFLQWMGGSCLSTSAEPTVCFTETDSAPDVGAALASTSPDAPAEVVTTELSDDGFNPVAAITSTGDRIVVWEERTATGEPALFASIVDPRGDILRPSFRIDAPSGPRPELPAISERPDGGFVVAWQETALDAAISLGATGGSASSIVSRLFDPTGGPVTGEIDLGASDQREPSVDVDPRDGEIAVTSHDDEGVSITRLAADGTRRGAPSRLSDDVSAAGAASSVTTLPDGSSFLVWQGRNKLLGRRIPRQGGPGGPVVELADPNGGAPRLPEVEATPDGEIVLVFERERPQGVDIVLRKFRPDGVPVTPERVAGSSDEPTTAGPQLAIDSDGGFVVAWEATFSPTSIVARSFDPTGSPTTPATEIVDGAEEEERGGVPSDLDLRVDERGEFSVVFRRRRADRSSAGIVTKTFFTDPGACSRSSRRACLESGRFEAELTWRGFDGSAGSAQLVPFGTDDSALYWFFEPQNWELLVKVLDACALNGHFWVFSAATTNVEYTLQVTDTAAGVVNTYRNQLGIESPAITDTQAFETCDVSGAQSPRRAPPALTFGEPVRVDSQVDAGSCVPGTGNLCLLDQRYDVEVLFTDFQGNEGRGTAVDFRSEDSGLFWFFAEDNWEMLVKVLDGCGINGHRWVFAASTTNLEFRLRVVDRRTGLAREYRNGLGESAPAIIDTLAFPECAP